MAVVISYTKPKYDRKNKDKDDVATATLGVYRAGTRIEKVVPLTSIPIDMRQFEFGHELSGRGERGFKIALKNAHDKRGQGRA